MFKKIEKFFDNKFMGTRPVSAGIYSYQSPEEAKTPFKWHLRVEKDGTGILVINASTVLHLNETATEYAYYLSQSKDKNEIVSLVSDRYDTTPTQAAFDLDEFTQKLTTLINSEDLDPVTYLGIDRVTPHAKKLTAPLRADCALTYKVSEGTAETVAPVERVSRELSTSEWETALENLWSAGVPHVIFTGGEPTLRTDLPDLLSKAESLGMVSGLLTDGLKLVDKHYLDSLLQNGLDHIMLLADENNPEFWKAIKLLVPADIFLTVHATLSNKNDQGFNAFLDRLAKEGVSSLSLSAESQSLSKSLEAARTKAAALNLHLVWDLPVPYSAFHPVALELESFGNGIPKSAGKTFLYIEPDGDVLPAQGMNRVKGNILKDPFPQIWKRL